jgi:hypothetical protein
MTALIILNLAVSLFVVAGWARKLWERLYRK